MNLDSTYSKLDTQHLLRLTEFGLKRLDWRDVETGAVTQEVVTHFLRLADAFWQHSGDPKQPHAELTSGKCSDGFVDVLRLLRYSHVCMLFGRELVLQLRLAGGHRSIDWVIGSDHAGAAISHSVAITLNAQHDFTEKAQAIEGSPLQFWRRFQIQPGETVLLCEEIITTAATLQAVCSAVSRNNHRPVTFVPAVLTVVNRFGSALFEKTPIISLASYDLHTWEQKSCPLCAAGSERLRPKLNWLKLTQ
ncbi:hypothetical protein KKF05_00975 [Patescibacteria group bacterium]|nr:hypothetical protein [Patescibacteria group bacterium]MBU1028787.1 hypothetical protein [Patescibacteria group bacterium]MBU1916175.1 hypothetical protein [Patescibacteria group bacterium]